MQKVKEQLTKVLESFERELGSRSSGLAYMQSEKEWVFKFLDDEVDYVKSLEKRLDYLTKDNIELRTKIQMPMPKFEMEMGISYQIIQNTKIFEWVLNSKYFATPILEHEKWDEAFWKRIRWQSLRGLFKLIRKEYDVNFIRFVSQSIK